MNYREINEAIAVVKHLRGENDSSALARKIELDICIEMYLLLPLKTNTADDVLFPGIDKEIIRSMLFGIIQGRPSDSRMPFVLRNQIYRSWERPAPMLSPG